MLFLTDATWPAGLKPIFDSCRQKLQTLPEHRYSEITGILPWPRSIRHFFVAPKDPPLKNFPPRTLSITHISSHRPILIAEIKVGLIELTQVS